MKVFLIVDAVLITVDFWYFWQGYQNKDAYKMALWGVMLIVMTIFTAGRLIMVNQ